MYMYFKVAFEVRCSLFNFHSVVQESWFVHSWRRHCWTLYTAVRRKTKWPHSCLLYCTMCSHIWETTGKLLARETSEKRSGVFICVYLVCLSLDMSCSKRLEHRFFYKKKTCILTVLIHCIKVFTCYLPVYQNWTIFLPFLTKTKG